MKQQFEQSLVSLHLPALLDIIIREKAQFDKNK